MSPQKPLGSLLDKVEDIADGKETDLRTIIVAFGDRAFGPVLTLCGLFLLTPLGAIPGIPVALSVIIISFAGQIVLGRDTPWMPQFLARVKFKEGSIEKTKVKVGPWLDRVDGLIRPRYKWAATDFARTMAALLSVVFAITMIPLGMVPFGVVLPGVIVCVIGLGITARDGLFLIIGYALSAGATVLIVKLIISAVIAGTSLQDKLPIFG